MFDPNQPRVPEGHHGGGRWTRGGYGLLSDLGKLRPPEIGSDEEQQSRAFRRQYALLQNPEPWNRERPDYGAWVGGPPAQDPASGGAATGAGRSVLDWASRGIGASLAAAVAAFEAWSRRDGPGRQTVIEFRAREFVRSDDGIGLITVKDVRSLDRATVATKLCRSLYGLEKIVDKVLKDTPRGEGQNNAQYGSALHKALADEIEKVGGRKRLKPEVSFVDDNGNATYGTEGSIRVDILQDLGGGTVCIYDLKTGRAMLSPSRMFELANAAFAVDQKQKRIWRVIVTQLQPGQKKFFDKSR